MTWTQPLLKVNGGDVTSVRCAECSEELGEEKAAPRCPDGRVRFFCVPERGGDPAYSCFVMWCRRHH